VQRPESHALNHARNVHAGNYADLPLFDMFFGTFHNPSGFAPENGLYAGASKRVWEMLWAHDVSREPQRDGATAALDFARECMAVCRVQ
jgi:sterol desaturase/sphingolipid hydroxylase (fatty acid hydroxylase superfamily)